MGFGRDPRLGPHRRRWPTPVPPPIPCAGAGTRPELPAEDWSVRGLGRGLVRPSSRRRLGPPEEWCPAPELSTMDWSARAPGRGLVVLEGAGRGPVRPRGTTCQAGSGGRSRELARKFPAAAWVWLPGRAARRELSPSGLVSPAAVPWRCRAHSRRHERGLHRRRPAGLCPGAGVHSRRWARAGVRAAAWSGDALRPASPNG